MKRTFWQTISVCLLCLGIILSVINKQISICSVPFLVMALGTFGSVMSIFIPNKYSSIFGENDWIKNNANTNNYKLLIKKRKHGMGKNPTVKVFEYNKNNNKYEEVICDTTIDRGNVTLFANSIFSGKVIIS